MAQKKNRFMLRVLIYAVFQILNSPQLQVWVPAPRVYSTALDLWWSTIYVCLLCAKLARRSVPGHSKLGELSRVQTRYSRQLRT